MISPESIKQAKGLTIPDIGDIHFMTEYDRRVWQSAFDWYNKTFSPEFEYKLSCRGCYDKVYRALKDAKND